MATNKEWADARRLAIYAEIAAMPTGPNMSDQGRSVDLIGYRRQLMDELRQLNELYPPDEQIFELRGVSRPGG